ncbi:MAG: hypothetical protein JWP97_4009 [Labilithrix sp.]|nr:hypothetical protein [Labilithrix sp.]
MVEDAHRPPRSLAELMAGPAGPVPPPIAIAIVLGMARALESAPGRVPGVAPGQVTLGRDGSLAVAAGPGSPAHRAPEEVAGQAPSERSEVFAVGVIAWELLAGRPLFARGDGASSARAAATESAPLVSALTSGVPQILDDVLASALARAPEARFDNVAALRHALSGARAAAGIPEASAADVARWVASRAPSGALGAAPDRGAAIPDLDLPGAGAMHRRSSGTLPAASSPSSMRMAAVRPVTAPGVSGPTSVRSAAAAAFAHLDLPVPSVPALSTPPRRPSGQMPSVAAPPVSSPPAHGIAFDHGDDDDLDMQIERNITTSAAPAAGYDRASRPSGMHAGPVSSRPSLSGTGLELGAPSRLSTRSRPTPRPREAGFFGILVGILLALVVAGGTGAGLFHLVHRAGGRTTSALLPHAFDGSSANESGAVALVTLVVAGAAFFVGLRLRPRSWWVVAAGGVLLLLALAMVTVTLASTGENPTPPDGVLLVPYLAPLAATLLGLGMLGRASRRITQARGAGKLGGLAIAAIAGALVFGAVELSALASLLPR